MPGADRAPVASCGGLCADYRTATGAAPALRDVDATFAAARLTVVAGPSGSGKSTLLRILAGRHRPTSGMVEVLGVPLTGLHHRARRRLRRHALGIVLQQPAANLIEDLRLGEQLELAARLRGAGRQDATALLDAVGLVGLEDHPVSALSGGQQQRAAFAAAAIGGPALVLADEPTAQLDGVAGRALVHVMRSLLDRGTSLVVASHDPEVIDAADDRLVLAQGRVAG
ncbi:MAG: ATP-binding cassette domain-containing protein [Acidimicrobiia bacterium]